MRKKSTFVTILFFSLAGCADLQSTPGCGDEITLDLVKSVIKDDLDRSWRGVQSLKIDSVITTEYERDVDAYTCVANLEINYKVIEESESRSESKPIMFSVHSDAIDPSQFLIRILSGP